MLMNSNLCTTVLVGLAFLAPRCISAEILFNNAEVAGLAAEGLATTARPGGGYYSEVQLGNAAAAWSFRHPTFRSGDDFQVGTPGWRVRWITVFGFQPSVHVPSVSTGPIEIRLGSVTGAVVASGTVVKAEMTNIYRVFNNVFQDEYQVQKITYKVNANLPPGYYWITFSAFGIGNIDGPWGPVLTKVGALTVPGANAKTRVSGPYIAWDPIIDPGSFLPQDLPFWIDGVRLQSIGPAGHIGPDSVPIPTPFDDALRQAFGTQKK